MSSDRKLSDEERLALIKTLSKLEMIHIPAGRFWMGSPETEEGRYDCEGPQHVVIVPSFFMGKYPVTQLQWRAVSLLEDVDRQLESAPSCFKREHYPVERVTWYEAVEFCSRLWKHTDKAYRLPSEAEWEYACRAGTIAPFHFGETISTDLANYNYHYEGTTEVGQFAANPFALHDMHGNVCEWCLDHWHESYEGAPTDGGAWMTGDDDLSRIVRGGSWDHYPRDCRSASRIGDNPDHRSAVIGFRVCCSPPRIP